MPSAQTTFGAPIFVDSRAYAALKRGMAWLSQPWVPGLVPPLFCRGCGCSGWLLVSTPAKKEVGRHFRGGEWCYNFLAGGAGPGSHHIAERPRRLPRISVFSRGEFTAAQKVRGCKRHDLSFETCLARGGRSLRIWVRMS
jgi:hypothetical protein